MLVDGQMKNLININYILKFCFIRVCHDFVLGNMLGKAWFSYAADKAVSTAWDTVPIYTL